MPDTKNPPQPEPLKAAALKYNKLTQPVPILAAKGKGEVATRILALAREHNIPIRSDADLVNILEKLDLEQEIPVEIYAVVAEIFSYIYSLQSKK